MVRVQEASLLPGGEGGRDVPEALHGGGVRPGRLRSTAGADVRRHRRRRGENVNSGHLHVFEKSLHRLSYIPASSLHLHF